MDSVILRLPFVKLRWPNAAATQFVVSRMNHEFAFAICCDRGENSVEDGWNACC